MQGDDDLVDLAAGDLDLVEMADGVLMRTHGPNHCVGPNCCLHNPSEHPLRDAPLVWLAEMKLMMRRCTHGALHPDPDSMSFRLLLSLTTGTGFYDGWHPCCHHRCCNDNPGEGDDVWHTETGPLTPR